MATILQFPIPRKPLEELYAESDDALAELERVTRGLFIPDVARGEKLREHSRLYLLLKELQA